ncbi:MAG: (2Fe-2S)-binding protein [Alphaproteobacteria bacterium]|nr:(2Fe-2S)-binding protein [Alphaproteobacteria bacterium]
MIVCVCRAISDRDIRAAAEAGAERCADVFRCRDTEPQCGSCVGMIVDLLRETSHGRSAAMAVTR